jgi:hypothetical protein
VGILSKVGEFLAKAIVSALDVEEVKKATSDKPEAEPTAFRKRALKVGAMRVLFTAMKWRMSTPYVLRVHYLIVGGNQDRFRVADSGMLENRYQWDLRQEITRETLGTKRVQIPPEGTPEHRGTLAFKRICMDATLNEMDKGNPIQWGQGLHLLEWDVAIRDLHQTNGEVAASLDLFYKNWSDAMSRFRKPLTWGAIRSSGSAEFGARLALLLFRDPASCTQQKISGRIAWKGGARSRAIHSRAVHERVVRFNGKHA